MSRPIDLVAMFAELDRDEGNRPDPYDDVTGLRIRAPSPGGKVTIGRGWNLDANPLPAEVVDRLTEISIDRAIEALDAIEPRWVELDEPRRRVLVGMAINLGALGLARFKRLWAAIRAWLASGEGFWLDRASAEILDSVAGRAGSDRWRRWAAAMRSSPPG